MNDPVLSAVIALGIGAVVGVVLFVPFVAGAYRRRGHLSFWRFAAWAAALVYFWAIWTYTLLPLPDGPIEQCAPANADPRVLFVEIGKAVNGGGNVFLHPAALQLELNVLLFVPLGVFIRVLAARGWVVATAVGFAVSLVVEVTQLTGVYGLYACAYRQFDVVDLMTNTAGALLGSVLALLLPTAWRRAPGAEADEPRPVTRWRRILAMFCDALAVTLVASGAAVLTQLVLRYVVGDRGAAQDGALASELAIWAPTVIWFVLVMATGRSVGDLAVRVEYRGGPLPEWLARLCRFAFGISGIALVSWVPGFGAGLAFGLALAICVAVLATRDGRGLPGLVTGRTLHDAREPEPADT